MKNYSYTSLILGIVVVVIVGILLIAFVRRQTSLNKQSEVSLEQVEQIKEQVLGKKHTVTTGETLWDIAVKNYNDGYKWVEIAKANNLANPDSIEVGSELQIPEVKIPASNGQVASGQTVSVKIDGDSYTVIRDDDLWDIAVRAYGDGYKWVEIARANNLVNPNLIHAGNKLTLPR
ncbi:LysM peptidoglycan-binding domain-containing protein [Candidatus Microgenomates bacterium]|nr:LysM peptidoglycan-binding domain-containing protein [Candidatus Microgenomates bacterium]MBI2622055.1 LysM peptidoglycan-binding domain-containing protein [Candidatus Microgenomates bacterium]